MHRYIVILLSLVILASSCQKEQEPPTFDEYEHVMIITSIGYNNLSSYLNTNIRDFGKGVFPTKHNDKAVLVFSHSTKNNNTNYKIETSPVLFRMYAENGKVVHDTLKVYPAGTTSADVATIEEVLTEIKNEFPSKSYGLLFSSHATGWLPVGAGSYDYNFSALGMDKDEKRRDLPLTKTIGAQYYRAGESTHSIEMDVTAFADAIPMHLDYIIFDACLMSCIETLWELKDKCDYIIASPSEVLAEGMVYKSLAWNIFSKGKADLTSIAWEYFKNYDKKTGLDRSASISLIDCKKLPAVASAFSEAIKSCTSEFNTSSLPETQRYFYDPERLCFYYDLRDLAFQAGAGEAQLTNLDKALAEAVPFHAETPEFFEDLLAFKRCCGISVYLPSGRRKDLETYYKTLDWSKETSYLQ